MKYLIRLGNTVGRWKAIHAPDPSTALIAHLQRSRRGSLKRLARRRPILEGHVGLANHEKQLHPNGKPKIVITHILQLDMENLPYTEAKFQVREDLGFKVYRTIPAVDLSHARNIIDNQAKSARYEEHTKILRLSAEVLQENGEWVKWTDKQGRSLAHPDADIDPLHSKNPPEVDSLWLVKLQNKTEIIRIAQPTRGEKPEGFFIPGSETIWYFNQIESWLKEIQT